MGAFALICVSLLSQCLLTSSFSTGPEVLSNRARFRTSSPSAFSRALHVAAASSDGDTPELSGALARLDQHWEIQQKSQPGSRWTKLFLKEESSDEQESTSSSEYVFLLEPPNKSLPSCLIVFAGGAGLGQYPHIAYNEFLLRLSDRLNAAVIAVPYSVVGLDHFGLAKTVGELSRRAIIQCEEDPTKLYSPSLPTYCISHSLGGKLCSIYMAATGAEYDGIGFLSFNNFGFPQTVGLAKSFAAKIQESTGLGAGIRTEVIDQVFSFAETVVGSIGVEFTPTPAETERILSAKYDEARQQKTRLFVFDDDDLDSTQEFVQACSGGGPVVSALPGSHLTPVFFKFSLEEFPEEVRGMAEEATGGISSLAFGDEKELGELVEEVCGWVLGKAPTRKPIWEVERPRISGAKEVEVD